MSTPRLILPPGMRRSLARRDPEPRWQSDQLLPPWVDANHPEARRGTLCLRAFDPVLVVAFDSHAGIDWTTGRRVHAGCFVVWGMSASQGRVPILLCENPDGTPQAAPIPWEWWLGELHQMRDGPPACERAVAANEARQKDLDRRREAEEDERLGLTAEGLLRNRCEDPQDVIDAVNRQVAGVKPPPRARKTF